jgi:hypothetical protein
MREIGERLMTLHLLRDRHVGCPVIEPKNFTEYTIFGQQTRTLEIAGTLLFGA